MKKAFFRKVVAEGIAMTGRYMYEYDSTRRAIHVTDTLGKVDKWVKEVDCEDYLFVKSPATPAPKKATPKAAPVEETVTLTKGELDNIIAQAIAQAMAKTTPAAAPVVEPAPVVESAPKKKTARAEKDTKYARTNKADLSKSTQQVWDGIKKAIPAATIVAYGSWLYITGTVKEDWATLKQFGCRWSRRRNCAYFVGELAA